MRRILVDVLLASCICLAACSPAAVSSSAPTSGQPQATQLPVGTSKPPMVTLSAVTPETVAPLTLNPTAEAAPFFPQALAGTSVPFEMVTQGDAMVGERVSPFAVAMRTTDQPPALFDELPAQARAAFEQALTNPGQSDLYLVIYGGRQPSGGYAVKIVSVAQEKGKLMVLYRVEGPPPGQGAADVITYPYAIARVGGIAIDPADVMFIEQKPAP